MAQETEIRPSETQGDAERLRVAAGDVGPEFSGGLQHGQGGGNAVDNQQSLVGMAEVGQPLMVLDYPMVVWRGDNHSGHLLASLLQHLGESRARGLAILGGDGHQFHAVVTGVCVDHPAHVG